MKKILIVLLLVLITLMPIFSAGAKEEAVKSENVNTASPGYPVVTEPVSMDIMIEQPPCVIDYNTNDLSKYMQDKTGLHINWIMIPEDSSSEKLQLTLASGDYPDAFMMGINFDDQLKYGSEEELLLPLNDYINEKYMPNLTKLLKSMPGSKGYLTLTDGNIYSLPRIEVCYHCINSAKMFVYQPFLDKLGLERPKTTDDFYKMLKTFKEKIPGSIPLAGSIKGWNDQVERWILNAFIYTDLDTNIDAHVEANLGYILNDDKISTILNTDDFREGLKYVNKLYDEGLLYQASFNQDSSQLKNLVESTQEPTVGVVAGGWRGMFTSVDGERFKNFQALEPLMGPKGVQETVVNLPNPGTGAFVISKNAKNPEALVRYIDFFYSTFGTLLQKYGFENDAWRWAKDTEVGLDGNPAIWYMLKPWDDKTPQNKTFIQGVTIAETSEFRLGQAVSLENDYYAAANNEKVLYDETANLYAPHANAAHEVPLLKYTSEESSEFSTIKKEFADYVRQNVVAFMVGNRDIENDNDWNSFKADLERLQLNKILANMQKAYDRQYK